jgi:hypothetical protein
MSRIRSSHPGLWTDEAFVSLSSFARLLFMGLWNECDDKGCFPWSPLQMKMRILPADNVDAAELLAELERAGCIRAYEVSGKKYGAVRNFVKFQRPKSPNDIHPAHAAILVFAGHEVEIPATDEEKLPEHFRNGSGISPQREEGEEEEGEEESEPNGSCASDDALKPDHVFDEWNQVAARIGKPRVRDATPARRATVRNRIAQYDISDFVNVFGKVERSPFLRGDTGWPGCTFDWVMKRANFQKIIEGNYDQ